MDELIISNRLKCIADAVKGSESVCDIGCDHGYLSIYIVKSGFCKRAFAMDLRKGPLEKAKANIKRFDLEEKIETVLSNGFEKYSPEMGECAVIAGMGGELIIDILANAGDKLDCFEKIILSPHTNVPMVRQYIQKTRFFIADEWLVKEEPKFYNILMLKKGSCVPYNEEEQKYGRCLIEKKDETLKLFIKGEILKLLRVSDELKSLGEGANIEKRLKELEASIKEKQNLYDLLDR